MLFKVILLQSVYYFLLTLHLLSQDYEGNQIPLLPTNDQTRCQIPWMRPQEGFFQYDPSSRRCKNFPYTGACRNSNQENRYENVFPSYDECSAASPDLLPNYETGRQPEFTVTQLEGRVQVVPSPDYIYEEEPGSSGIQSPEYGNNQGQDYGFKYNSPNIINGQFVENENDFGKTYVLY